MAEFTPSPQPTTILSPSITFTDYSALGDLIRWYYGDGDSIVKLYNDNQVHTYKDTGLYEVSQIVTTDYGCKDEITHTVYIGPDFVFYIPNAFTPDGDGLNDLFMGHGIGIKEFELSIFDRWGKQVKLINSLDMGWDGKFGGVFVPEDVYVYTVKITDIMGGYHCCKAPFTGHVTLIR